MQNQEQEYVDRVERIRRVLEDRKDDAELFSPEYRSLTPLNLAAQRQTKSLAGVDLSSIFSDFRISVLSAVEDCDKVVVRWRLRGKWTGALPFGSLKPTGQQVDVTGINIYRFVGDRIVENIGELDAASFHDQACERVNPGAERVNPAQCVEVLQALARRPETLAGGGGQF